MGGATTTFPESTISDSNLFDCPSVFIVGIDLAWGEEGEDGLCLIEASRDGAKVIKTVATQGDDALLAWLTQHTPPSGHVLLSIDAPLIIPNATGSRPAEKQVSSEFWKYHASCHSSNTSNPNCARPIRVAQSLRQNGFTIGFQWCPIFEETVRCKLLV